MRDKDMYLFRYIYTTSDPISADGDFGKFVWIKYSD